MVRWGGLGTWRERESVRHMTERGNALFSGLIFMAATLMRPADIFYSASFSKFIYIHIIPTLNCFKENRLTYDVSLCAFSLSLSHSISPFLGRFFGSFSFFFLAENFQRKLV